MTTLERLDASQLKAVVTGYRDALRAHQEALNRLNVYPVPDGDTGTNMALTLESVVSEMEGADGMVAVCKAMSHGSLMGARGNSGVILSQILRGIASAFERTEAGDGREVARALAAAAAGAYSAVLRPVEGTILTVAKAAGDAASGTKGKLVDVLEAAKAAASDALSRTPDMLPVLKKAGVVDAGGAGYVLLIDAFLHVADGRVLPAPPAPTAGAGAVDPVAGRPGAGEGHGVGDLRYEVMYLLEAPDGVIPGFKEAWAALGDSIVVVGGDGIWNCHIHTDEIGPAIEAGIGCGRPTRIRVTDLLDQVEEERWVREASASPETAADGAGGAGGEVHPPATCSVVAVATGPGVRRILRSLGVHGIVAGGQSMNPSTAQILEAVESAPANEVVVLPNNKNIIPVAEQVGGLTDKLVRVLPTVGVAEGLAALLAYDPAAGAEENASAMAKVAAQVVSGEVTRAVRSSNTDAGPVEEGDFLGLSASKIVVAAPVLAEAATALLDRLVTEEHEVVTVIEGEGAGADDTRRITNWLEEHRPGVTAEVHHGGQPLYPYLFSIE